MVQMQQRQPEPEPDLMRNEIKIVRFSSCQWFFRLENRSQLADSEMFASHVEVRRGIASKRRGASLNTTGSCRQSKAAKIRINTQEFTIVVMTRFYKRLLKKLMLHVLKKGKHMIIITSKREVECAEGPSIRYRYDTYNTNTTRR